jgi:hypothetical protein
MVNGEFKSLFLFCNSNRNPCFLPAPRLDSPQRPQADDTPEAPCGTSCGSARVPQKRPPEGPNSFRYRKRIEKDGKGDPNGIKISFKTKKKHGFYIPRK